MEDLSILITTYKRHPREGGDPEAKVKLRIVYDLLLDPRLRGDDYTCILF